MEEDAEGPGVRWFDDGLPKLKDGGNAAAFDTRLALQWRAARRARLPAGCVSTDTSW